MDASQEDDKMLTVIHNTAHKVGNSLTTIDRSTGWVEWLRRTGKVYQCIGPSQKLYQKLQKNVRLDIIHDTINESHERIGIIKSLANERLIQPFILPPMLIVNSAGKIELTTGTCRLMGELMCGTSPKDWSFIMYAVDDKFKTEFDTVIEIVNTEQYEQLYKLTKIDYQIVMTVDEQNTIRFLNSIVMYSLYDNSQHDKRWMLSASAKSKLFFDRIKQDEKIKVEVHCTESVAKFIPASDKNFTFDVVYEDADEWQFSYGTMLSAYSPDNKSSNNVLQLWVYDITEPLYLESLVLWLDVDHTAYYTKNRKVVAFVTTHATSIKEIGDFVK